MRAKAGLEGVKMIDKFSGIYTLTCDKDLQAFYDREVERDA